MRPLCGASDSPTQVLVLVFTAVIVGVGWLISIGLYEIGLWPLGAILRVGVWIVALFGLYWIIKHLRKSPSERMLEEIERMREAERRGYQNYE